MPRSYHFNVEPRKVHLAFYQGGATYRNEMPEANRKRYADTLCKGNWAGPDVRTTSNPAEVTCKICRRDHRFPGILDSNTQTNVSEAPSPVEELATRPEGGRPTRYRVNWRGQLVLQVCTPYNNADPRDPRDLGQTFMRWRDARLEDLGRGVV